MNWKKYNSYSKSKSYFDNKYPYSSALGKNTTRTKSSHNEPEILNELLIDLKTPIEHLVDALILLQEKISTYTPTNDTTFETYLEQWVTKKDQNASSDTKAVILSYIYRLVRSIYQANHRNLNLTELTTTSEKTFITRINDDLQAHQGDIKSFSAKINPENTPVKFKAMFLFNLTKELEEYIFPRGKTSTEIFKKLQEHDTEELSSLQEILVCPVLHSEGFYDDELKSYPGLSRTIKNILREITMGLTVDLRRIKSKEELGYTANELIPIVYLDDVSILFSGNLKKKELEVFDKLCQHLGFKIYDEENKKCLLIEKSLIDLFIETKLAEIKTIGTSTATELLLNHYTFFQYYLAICSAHKKDMGEELVRWVVTLFAKIILDLSVERSLNKDNVFKPVLKERWFLIETIPPLANIVGLFMQGVEWSDIVPQTSEKRRAVIDGLTMIPESLLEQSKTFFESAINKPDHDKNADNYYDPFDDKYWENHSFKQL